MLEYVAAILGLEVGNYYHIADNLHYYEWHSDLVRQLAEVGEWEDEAEEYDKRFQSLEEFDDLVSRLSNEEVAMRTNIGDYSRIEFEDPFFEHWYEVLYQFNYKRRVI
jgi:thymidylate synthase